eukprot:maker-scaffold817_size93049-snap-gene-0.10 protein:Tk02220 transcript:maker-scaffold817_size93049-snap-gene-0.10-mRNA-1 annotation:"uncharacterized protein LOC767623"
MGTHEDNLVQQLDEIEALTSIFPDRITAHNHTSIDLVISAESKDDCQITLHVSFPTNYPSTAPPKYDISAPLLSGTDKRTLHGQLNGIYLENIGQPVVFAWYTAIQEYLEEWNLSTKKSSPPRIGDELIPPPAILESKCPEICTGECVEDRKSIFQAHFAKVRSVKDVDAVLSKLKENRKIAHATHNMFAYRIMRGSQTIIQDCDDDGESQAGSRMLHLLEIIGVENCLVVVTRWYGGVHLGPDRFKHINSATRNILEIAGAIPSEGQKNGSRRKHFGHRCKVEFQRKFGANGDTKELYGVGR